MKKVKLKEVYDLQNGYAFKSTDYIDESNTVNCRMSNIRPGAKFDIEYSIKYLPDEYAQQYKEYLLNDGDLIIAMTDLANDPKILGVPTIVETKGYNLLLNQRVGKLVNKNREIAYDRYFKYALSMPSLRGYYQKFAGGGLQINIGKKDILDVEVPIMNLSKQKRIVVALDKCQELIDKRKKQIKACNDLIKSQFMEMFGNPITNPKNWEEKSLKDVCKVNPKKSEDKRLAEGLEVSFVAMPSVTEKGQIDTSIIKLYDEVKTGFTYFAENDVLFAKITPCMENGKGAVAVGLKNDVGFGSTEFHVLRPVCNKANPYWMYYLTMFSFFREEAERKMTGSAGQRRVPISFLEGYEVGVPPIELQNQFAHMVKQVDKLKFEMQQSLIELENNFDSLMQRAFKGELF